MKRLIIILALLAFAHEGMTAQTDHLPSNDFAIVVYKYNATVNILARESASAPYDVLVTGGLHRSFPTGPKVLYGDERIPEGIYEARIVPDGSSVRIEFPFQSLPGIFEHYRVTGPTLDRNVIPAHADVFEDITRAALTMRAAGHRTIPVMILPGTLEPAVAERLERARNVKPWQSLDAVRASCLRWKPVEEYFIRTGFIPKLRFDGEDIIIVPAAREREQCPVSLWPSRWLGPTIQRSATLVDI